MWFAPLRLAPLRLAPFEATAETRFLLAFLNPEFFRINMVGTSSTYIQHTQILYMYGFLHMYVYACLKGIFNAKKNNSQNITKTIIIRCINLALNSFGQNSMQAQL